MGGTSAVKGLGDREEPVEEMGTATTEAEEKLRVMPLKPREKLSPKGRRDAPARLGSLN